MLSVNIEIECNSSSKHWYSWTSRKQPPKMWRLSGRLREVVSYKNQTTGVSSKKMYGHIYFMEIIYYMQSLSYNMCSSMLNVTCKILCIF